MSCTISPNKPALGRGQAGRSLLMAAIGAATLAASFVYPWSQTGPILCPLRLLTGLPCPGCGLTRSFCALAHGDLYHAVTFHLLGPVLFAGLVLGVPMLTFQALTRRRIPWLNDVLYSTKAGYLAAAVLFGYHFARLVYQGWSGALWNGMQKSVVVMAARWVFG